MSAETFTRVVAILSVVGSSVAFVVNVWAARTSIKQFRPLWAVVAFFSLVYMCGYVYLAWRPWDTANWSTIMRPIGLVVWPAVWVMPTWHLTRAWLKLKDDHQ